LREVLTKRIREDIDANIGHHAACLALNRLVVERLTLPGSSANRTPTT
jgi:hypothetical protein